MNQNRINQIKQASSLSEIVKDFGIALKANRGKCPLCESSSNSFSVNSDYFNCFKCGGKGDVVEFVQQTQGLDFVNAMKLLGNRAGISTEESITKAAGDAPKAAAKMYLTERGLDIDESWYSQEIFGYSNKQSATVRFAIGETYWERIIDAHLFTHKAHFKKGSTYKGECWQPPAQRIVKNDRIYITEGIFDAIALMQGMNYKVASAMSTSNFPQNLIDKHKDKGITWCLALDNGEAGSYASKKWAKILRDMDEKVEVYYPSDKRDWNDLYRSKALNADLLEDYWWRGQVLVSQSASERMAWLSVEARVKNKFIPNKRVVTFANCYFGCSLTDEANAEENEQIYQAIEDKNYFQVVNLLTPSIKSNRIGTAVATLLYTQFDPIDSMYSYYFDIAQNGVKKSKKVALAANMTIDAKTFHTALWGKVGQSSFRGSAAQMNEISDGWVSVRKPTVETIRHMGYSPTHKAYVFENFGYKDGRMIKANEHDYLNIGNLALKTTFDGWDIPNPDNKKSAWFDDFYLSSGNEGLTALAFWCMSLFASQVRSRNGHGEITFFEYTGIAHSGKSSVISFLWKLIGRENFEGEDPEKMTPAALARYFMQASNIPAVLLEGDRSMVEGHRKKFSMDQVKTLHSGHSPYGRGIRNNGINIDSVPFLGTLVISQNAAVEGEPQILNRIVQCVANKKGFSHEGFEASKRLKRLKGEQVIHFLHDALSKESKIMEEYGIWFDEYTEFLLNRKNIKDARIAEGHAQIMAFGKCLKLIVPEFDDHRLKKWIEFMVDLAVKRQTACQTDTPLVQKFWEIYDTFNEEIGSTDEFTTVQSEQLINHSKDPDLIAISLPLFKKMAEENRQQIDVDALKALLVNSKRHKFIKQKKINSVILGKIVHCWIFKK
ncbi:CHC2 zinc finger domain-containing protein [Bathymodiolus septemdierum thioautotrophic gill symbiont]|uniref:Phage-related protein n=1 Tax=endosymbiont of Bathymodiolus septemdierum str. Myojin knoll TaxID=1303921 RepID=A0A0P0URL7_9GAMM|nr:CHC2 zinc finger domain-containing protein [Bathymodiolus septemdierum thioautotrophic gill symbiont]BAS67611.1 phage-related protein [endosymbiont of Bathymodiolus septemdierum str. Myojin knoll]